MKKLIGLCEKLNLKYRGKDRKGFYLVYDPHTRTLFKGCTIDSTIRMIKKEYNY